MLQRQPPPDKDNPDPRGDLDRALEVAAWTTPTSKRYQVEVSDDNAPAWWRGDEEATDTFLRGMGVKSFDELAQKR